MEKILLESKLNIQGNKIVVCVLEDKNAFKNVAKNLLFRKELVNMYKGKCDSVVLLSSLDKRLLYDVFEPNTGSYGTFSLMCGNGLKAAACLIPYKSSIISTKAGKFIIKKNQSGVEIEVGKFVFGIKARERFVDSNISKETLKERILNILNLSNQVESPIIEFGYNAENSKFTGEPHLVIFFQNSIDREKLRKYTIKYSLKILQERIFNQDINITFASLLKLASNTYILNACTFERNLKPENAITGSCGTGSMAVANICLNSVKNERFNCNKAFNFIIEFPKGNLNVKIDKGNTIIYGKESYESF